MKKVSKTALLGQKGQTAIEYILLLLVMVSIITSILAYVKNKYLGNPEQCDLPANRDKFICKINNFIKPTGGNKPFQYYPIKR